MGKIRVHKIKSGVGMSLVDIARKVFSVSKTKSIVANDRRFVPQLQFTRQELRALERAGYVKSYKAVGERKFTDTTPPIHFVYEWNGPVNSEGRPHYG